MGNGMPLSSFDWLAENVAVSALIGIASYPSSEVYQSPKSGTQVEQARSTNQRSPLRYIALLSVKGDRFYRSYLTHKTRTFFGFVHTRRQ